MSAIVFAGSAQFAIISILAAAAAAAAAVRRGDRRSRADELALPADGHRARAVAARNWLKRAAQGQTVVDASWAMANRGDGRFAATSSSARPPSSTSRVRARGSARSAAARFPLPSRSGSTRSVPRSSSRCSSPSCATRARAGWVAGVIGLMAPAP
ncbi:MAG: hypothetical protein M3401_11620 [Actinomycetota bacterium]|nr:hypothetical protein [Actinomycetota bacterium]